MSKEIFGFDEKLLSEIREMFDKTRIDEIEIEDNETYLRITRYVECECNTHLAHTVTTTQVSVQPQPIVSQQTATIEAKPQAMPETQNAKVEEYDETKYYKVKSPLVGTFYETPSPTSPPFVKLGDVVMPDTTLCIVEAMKVMNEIKAEVKGKIVKILKTNGSPVKADEDMFIIEKM